MWDPRSAGFALFIGVLASSGVGCDGGSAEASPPGLKRAIFMIDGLDSQRGLQKIQSALHRVRGVSKVQMDLPKAEALVTFDVNLANEHGLEEAIEATGYKAALGDLDGS